MKPNEIMELKDTRPVKAYMDVRIICPKCGWVLVASLQMEHNQIACQNLGCELLGLLFERPSVTLHRIFDDDGEQKKADLAHLKRTRC